MSTDTQEAGPVAMGTYDSSVYLGWIRAMGDVLMNHSARDSLPGEVVTRYGGLISALAESAEELLEKERRR